MNYSEYRSEPNAGSFSACLSTVGTDQYEVVNSEQPCHTQSCYVARLEEIDASATGVTGRSGEGVCCFSEWPSKQHLN